VASGPSDGPRQKDRPVRTRGGSGAVGLGGEQAAFCRAEKATKRPSGESTGSEARK